MEYSKPVKFEQAIVFRLKENVHKKMTMIINMNKDKYYNEAHFIRCAINKLIKEENK